MPNYQEIRDLSNKSTLTSRHICDEHNIAPNAIQAVHRGIAEDGSVKVRSSLIHGTKSPDLDSEPIDQDTTIAVGSVTKMFTSAALLKLWDQELTTKKSGLAEGQSQNFPNGIDTQLSHFDRVTLRDLLNHAHALESGRDDAVFKL